MQFYTEAKIASILSNSVFVKSIFSNASILFCNCPTELAPINTEVILLSLSNQANAIWANDWFLLCAMSFKATIILIFSSVMCSGFKKAAFEALEFSGIPLRYLSVKSPCAYGEKAMQPIPFSPKTSSKPSSGVRTNIEYFT